MKKYISFLSFIALFFIGIQFSSAQTTDRQQSPEAIAKQKTYQIHQLVNLTGEQQSAIFRALVDAEQNLSALSTKENTDMIKQEGTKTVNQTLDETFKSILSPEQYNTYKESLLKERK